MKQFSSLLLISLSINLFSSPIPKPPDLGVGSYILYEPTTDTVIASFNENESVEVASLTKLMTSYVVADQIKQGYISMEAVSYTHLRAPRDRTRSRMPSSA